MHSVCSQCTRVNHMVIWASALHVRPRCSLYICFESKCVCVDVQLECIVHTCVCVCVCVGERELYGYRMVYVISLIGINKNNQHSHIFVLLLISSAYNGNRLKPLKIKKKIFFNWNNLKCKKKKSLNLFYFSSIYIWSYS